ncbi:DUF3179 domain-containing (seleno)protein [Tautonia plasticadhaerens]|uniref:DUF3179 domain-containing protein n=1 Tax=Tautonia plasticadhaerens TaxID=2527974 RepID=A0A518H2Q5_9BACT|nr:DUF3179 domain-containing (seleno)protein [Tautonia plasticadhaerens]QDV35097.1 hypothetical protein ElP_29990 [Tautonia plasticadhaerens]
MRKHLHLIGLVAASLLALKVVIPVAEREPPDRQEDAPGPFTKPMLILGPMAPMVDIPTADASRASDLIRREESVLGVEINGEARAYPIEMMRYLEREILNDTLGGVPIAVTWCDRCQSGIVYGREVEGRELTFHVNGMLYHGNMVMVDSETGTLWSQLQGLGLDGSLAGRQLGGFPAVITPWHAWQARHPQTSVLNFDREPEGPSPPPEGEILPHQERLSPGPSKDFLLGINRGDEGRAWKLGDLRRNPVLNELACGIPLVLIHDSESDTFLAFDRRVDGIELTFRGEGGRIVDDQTGSVWDAGSGRAVDGPRSGSILKAVRTTITLASAWEKLYPPGPRP